ncbi:MAG: hypothetical protein ACFFDB_00160 [Promethearchaeota archaeon]
MKPTEIEESFEKTFKIEKLAIDFVDIFIGYLISVIIETPLIALTHFIITREWIFALELYSFLLFLGIIGFTVFILYYFSKKIRQELYEKFIRDKTYLYYKILSIVFALIIIDVFIEVSYFISAQILGIEMMLNTIYILERVLAGIILIIAIWILYMIIKFIKFEDEEWAGSMQKATQNIDDAFDYTFTLKNLTYSFIDILISYIISIIIEAPLISFVKFIRTRVWTYQLDVLGLFVFVLLTSGLIIALYVIVKPFRQQIRDAFIQKRDRFLHRIISIIFALLIIDVFIEIALFISMIPFQPATLDLGALVDKIVSSIILIFIILGIRIILEKKTKSKN